MQNKNIIFSVVTNFISPFILLFVFYIQLNGESSPGGGFQAGAIFASLLIALDLTKDLNLTTQHLLYVGSIGLLSYILPGMVSIFSGANFLNYSTIANSNLDGQKIGIFIVEIGIGLVVSSILYLIYKSFIRKSA
ncbi:MAG: Multisubunit Na+/H+ antiporter, MnhB subunit [Pseudomonadota bacterium]|jgi:multicomponent Na+:H+ antiporter subunit B